jgi:DNA-binding NarL/FixJ family response regulator
VALAAAGDETRSLRSAEDAEATTIDIQTRTLASLARTISAIKSQSSRTPELASAAVDSLLEGEDYDNLVYAYRGFPQLLPVLAASRPDIEGVLRTVVHNARDHRTVAAIGFEMPVTPALSPLSTREREVYGLLCDGMTNREIADALYISEATAKAHVRHILEKLNARSRTEAVLLQDT